MPFVRTVFGYSPVPQRINEPKSLYQSPSGAQGSVTTQQRSFCRSSRVIALSATRSRRCSHSGRGRLTKRIFGNRASPEDRADQIFADFAPRSRILFRHEPLIDRRQPGPRCRLRFNTPLGKRYQGPAHCHISFLGHAPDFTRELRRDRYTLPHGSSRPWARWFASGLHNFYDIVQSAPLWCTPKTLRVSAWWVWIGKAFGPSLRRLGPSARSLSPLRSRPFPAAPRGLPCPARALRAKKCIAIGKVVLFCRTTYK
jgi:hypothetical protein